MTLQVRFQKMVKEEAQTHAFALQNGNYKATGNFYVSLNVMGAKGILKDPSNTNMNADIMLGDFGEVDPEVAKKTGQQFYNIRIVFYFGKEITLNICFSKWKNTCILATENIN